MTEISLAMETTINTSNSSIARNGASVISWSARAKHNVEKERSPPNQTTRMKLAFEYLQQAESGDWSADN